MYIGLDIGTSGTKAAYIDAEGHTIVSAQVTYGFSNICAGHRELDAEQIWQAACICLKQVGSGKQVKTITVSALGEAIIPIDRQGVPLSAGITGTDSRGVQQLVKMEEKFGAKRLTEITGLNLSTIYSANKIMWLKENMPKLYEQAWKIMTFQDYIVYRLTGIDAIDYSMASRTMLFDIQTNNWSEPILKSTGIDRKKLSVPYRGGSIIGKISAKAADSLGLCKDVSIVVGTHDHICNAIGSGAISYGDCADTVGTTEGLTAVVKREELTPEAIKKYQISCEPFISENMFNTVAWSNASGVLLKWFATELEGSEKVNLESVYEKLNLEMKKEPTELLILPHFQGAATPYMDEESKGVIFGLTLGTKRSDIYKALMESANYELRLIMECMQSAGIKIKKLVATGGALSEQLLQIKADIMGMTVHTVKGRQTGTMGGAILGAVASGDFQSVEEAVQVMVLPGRSYDPKQDRYKIYQTRYELYKELYKTTANINHRL